MRADRRHLQRRARQQIRGEPEPPRELDRHAARVADGPRGGRDATHLITHTTKAHVDHTKQHRHRQGARGVVHGRRLHRPGRRHAPPPDGRTPNLVHFTPGARTVWHMHPLGQTSYVTEGIGRCQKRGGPVEGIRPGDRVFFGPAQTTGTAPRPTASWSTSPQRG
jgi:quercetin dioxygenase-like cupin family protein